MSIFFSLTGLIVLLGGMTWAALHNWEKSEVAIFPILSAACLVVATVLHANGY